MSHLYAKRYKSALYALVVFFVLFISILTSAKSSKCICRTASCNATKIIQDIRMHLLKKASPKAVPAKDLAPAILQTSLKYGLDYHLLMAVILLESRGVSTAHNKRTCDHGIGQINIRTAQAMGLSMTCLYNWRCNLDATARILSEIQDGNICRYNVGTGNLIGNLLVMCRNYERRLASI